MVELLIKYIKSYLSCLSLALILSLADGIDSFFLSNGDRSLIFSLSTSLLSLTGLFCGEVLEKRKH